MDTIQKIKVNVSSVKEEVTSAGDNESLVFDSTKKDTVVANNAEEDIAAEINEEIKGEGIQFDKDITFSSVLKELYLLGNLEEFDIKRRAIDEHISDRKGRTDHQCPQSSCEKQTVNDTQTAPNALMEVKGKKRYNIRIPSDKYKCNIYSACILDDEAMILTDFNNNNLKRVDSFTYTVTDYCDVAGDLNQVCQINYQEIAVSCGDGNCVQFVSCGSKMIADKQIKTDHRCDGLSFVAGQLYISDCNTVYIYTGAGIKLQQFNKDQSGNRLYSCIYSLAVSSDGSKIYVADRNYGLIALDRNGTLLRKFNTLQLQYANDVCITNNGSVLVCGHDSSNVLQFTPNCERVGEVLKCSGKCRAICYDHRHSKLIIGYGFKDTIDVYEVVG